MKESREVAVRRRQPKQHRSIETYSSILEAAAMLFAQRGYEQTTTHQIAAQAHISVGALYRYFQDKQGILLEIYQREISGIRQEILQEFNVLDVVGHDVRHLLHKTLTLTFKLYRKRVGLLRVLGEQSRKVPALFPLRQQQEEELHQAVLKILRAAPGVQLRDLEVSAYLVRLFMESLLDDYLLYGRANNAFDDERIIEGACDFIRRYVLGQLS